MGYGYRSKLLTANVNLYNTSWKDKTLLSPPVIKNSITYYANIPGVNALHRGIEVDFVINPVKNPKINGMASIGDWKWKNNIDSVHVYDENQTLLSTVNLRLKDVHVGNSAQTVLGIGADYEVMKGFTIGANYTYFDRLYAYFDVNTRSTQEDVWKMPSYGLLDMNLRYDFTMGGLNTSFFVNAYNALNTEYFSDGTDKTFTTDPSSDLTTAQVFYGLGTTWSIGLKVKF